ncbi:Ref family recombination enhancement nuclease [Lelliottia wanjuensis]|uniref:Ref family recombination enhancement nuclease n=1 Tax=Lelliottia wanjuensis TaxID=3050585 RepID=UPI00254EB491|nr:Ref family recombination enhancement nuclease [Lelliottia sp. V86_10]MDK9586717.1 Ref family recombination enhancement nuclease [Lelliottia sp. V86_10]
MAKHQRKAEKEHAGKVADLGCVACYVQAGVWGTPGELHHLRADCGAAQRAGWGEVICLCPEHHRNSSREKFAIHAGQKTFEAHYGTEKELLALTLENL